MNRNKIKGIILALGAVTAMGFGGNVDTCAAEKKDATVVVAAAQVTEAEKAEAIERINNGQGN